MIWYLLYPFRGTTEAPDLSPSNPVRASFTRYGNYVARHVILALLISGIVATILIFPIPYLFTDDFTNGASNLPHHVWTVARPLGRDAPIVPDVIMRSIWVHGDYMQALNKDLLSSALELQDELLGPTDKFSPSASQEVSSSHNENWPMPSKTRDALHIVNGLTNQSWLFHSPLLYWDCSRQQILADRDLITTVNERKTQSTSANVTLRHSIVFSGKKFEERRLLAADALVITLLHLRDSPVGRQWEHIAPLLTQQVKDKWDIYPQSGNVEKNQLYEFQFRPISLFDILSLALAYGLTFLYFLASLSKLRAIKSKTGLTVTVITQIIFSIMSSFTVCAIFNINLSRIPRAAYPLVVLAISLENMFRIIYAVILTPAENSSSSRVGSAFGQTAHIALASTLQNVSILLGLSQIVSPGVAGFCIFAAIATVFDFFYLSTFFLSVLSVDVRRVELQDELSKASILRHNHDYCEMGERPSWISNIVKGKVALSTRIAGTVVMISFVMIAQWHFFGDVSVPDLARRLVGMSAWESPATPEAVSPLEEIHQARSPGSWLRLQDHETAQEVINAIKPSAFSYTAKVYDPIVFVLKHSNRIPPQQKQKLLPAAYDFVDHHLAQFIVSIVLVGAGLRLLASYLLWADEEARDRFPDSDENQSLSVKTLLKGHTLDVVMITASPDGRIVSAGLDRTIRVWDIRSQITSYELPGTKVLDGRGLFPVLAMTVDAESKWLAVLSTTQIRLWNLAEYTWGEPTTLESGSHKPELFCFHPNSTQQAPRLLIARKDGILGDVSLFGDRDRSEASLCDGQLLTARFVTYKGMQYLRPAFVLERESAWQYESLPLNAVSDITLHQVVPLTPHPLFLIGAISSVYLVNAHDGVVQHVFTTEPMVLRSIQCEYSDNRYNTATSSIGFSTFTLGYLAAGSEECTVTNYHPADGSEAIAAFAPSGGAGGGWCTWEESIETKKQIKDPGAWEIVKGRSVIGVRQIPSLSRSPKQGHHYRRSAATRVIHKAPARWQAWTSAIEGHPEADEVRPLFNHATDSEELLVIPGLGPKVKIGLRRGGTPARPTQCFYASKKLVLAESLDVYLNGLAKKGKILRQSHGICVQLGLAARGAEKLAAARRSHVTFAGLGSCRVPDKERSAPMMDEAATVVVARKSNATIHLEIPPPSSFAAAHLIAVHRVDSASRGGGLYTVPEPGSQRRPHASHECPRLIRVTASMSAVELQHQVPSGLASTVDRPPPYPQHQSLGNPDRRLPEQLVSGLTTYWMASSEVDQKFLGRLARAVEQDNPLLSSMLFKILGLSLNLAEQLVAAKKQRKPTPVTSPLFLRRILHILWLSREGLVMLQQYVIPMVGNYVELKVLAYKLRASFHHIFVLFHNSPPVSTIGSWTPEAISAAFAPIYKDGHGLLGVEGDPISRSSSVQPTHALEGGPVGPPPGFETQVALLPPSFLLPEKDYLPTAHEYFQEAMDLADQLLWGSHSLRLSVKTEYVAFLYECVHDADSSRQLAKKTVAEVYDATEGMDDDMFRDACELVTVLGKMMKRGLGPTSSVAKGKRVEVTPSMPPMTKPPPGMENAI
ncbi:hypothetical protein PWT90_00635 [Aphanocladium album]|nr:hypothetical protein PWT90_00635 [Aphanocladium album]